MFNNRLIDRFLFIDYRFFEIGVVIYGPIVSLGSVQLDDTIAYRVHKFSVLTRHQEATFEIFETVVERRDGFEI